MLDRVTGVFKRSRLIVFPPKMSSRGHQGAVCLSLFAFFVSGCAAIRREEGSDVQLPCDVPIPSEYVLEWKRGAQVILRYTSTSGAAIVPADSFAGRVSLVGATSAVGLRTDLGITSVKWTDSGQFYCSVRNLATSDSPVTSARQTLTVDGMTTTKSDDVISRRDNMEGYTGTSGVQLVTVILMTAAAGVGGMLAGAALALLCRAMCRHSGRDDESRVYHSAEVDF
ncbi:uncharacterized protein [Branchiostoma lanceolatum]|uniref:uncharacterized protein isoform X2 n=1 Tax=Branchiostoma lanceolatum TaxID=7740 RepID=UPI0034520D3C